MDKRPLALPGWKGWPEETDIMPELNFEQSWRQTVGKDVPGGGTDISKGMEV